ncbi:MAG: hypothetical protein KDI88_00450 [Gammaproteobacteria bacterium]|nr:hypothetical protein [Gammaproteobacteria bacterium]
MTREEPPSRQNELFLRDRGAPAGTAVSAKDHDAVDLDPDLDELVDRLIEAPEFDAARQITEALGIDPDAASGSDRKGQHGDRDVDGALKDIDFDLADLLARASDELEQRPMRGADKGDTAVPVSPAGSHADGSDGFAADRFEPDPAQLDSFRAPARPRAGARPHLALVEPHRPDRVTTNDGGRDVVPPTVQAPAETPVAASPAAPVRPRVVASEPMPRTRADDAKETTPTGRATGVEPSPRDIEVLWQETTRLERRFTAAQDLRDSLGRGAAAAPRVSAAPAVQSPHPRFPEQDSAGGPGRWQRRLVSWLAAGLVAAAIIAAAQAGWLDPARAWLHQQLDLATAAVGNAARPAPAPRPPSVDGNR